MTTSIDISPDDLEIVQQILAEHIPELEVRAFGSRATWTAREYSDLDLVLMAAEPLDIRRLGDLQEAFVQSDLPFQVDIVDWASASESFRSIIEKQHVIVQQAMNRISWLYHPEFPEHWECKPLHSMAQWINGLAFRNIEFTPTGKPVIKIAELKNGISNQTRFTHKSFDDSVHITSGDLLFSWSGQPETSIDVFWWHGPDGWLNQHIFRVKPIDDINPRFFFYLLRYLKPNFTAIARNKQTTGLGHVTKHDLKTIKAAFPQISEQQTIAHILGTLDDKIELNRKMSETLEEMAQALFKSWFVDFDPVRAKREGRWRRGESLPGLPADLWELFPDQIVNSELGQVPNGWKIATLNHVAEQIRKPENPIHSPNTLFNHFSIPAFDNGQTPRPEYGKDIKSTKLKVFPGTVLLSRLNPEIKRVWLVGLTIEEKSVCSTEFLILRSRFPLTQSYTYCLLRSHLLQRKIKALVTGTSKSHQRVHADAVLSLGVILPPKPVVEAFDLIASKLLNRVLHCRREIKTASALRDTLLPRIVSGEMKVEQLVL